MDTMTAREDLRKIITKMYEESGVEVNPTFPRVLVRVLPKEQQTASGLYLPDQQQNKPTAEGIVLKTYKPFFMTRLAGSGAKSAIHLLDKPEEIIPSVQPGDHVLFQHFEGTPVPRMDEGRGDYRLIDEFSFHAIIRCQRKPVRQWLADWFTAAGADHSKDWAENFLKEADVIRRDEGSKTLSGV